MKLDEVTAEVLIAALVISNDGELILHKEILEGDFTGVMLQVSEDLVNDLYIFRAVRKEDVELDGVEQVSAVDN